MTRQARIFLTALALAVLATGCSGNLNPFSSSREIPYSEAPRITVQELAERLADPETLILDVREARHWQPSQSKIPGAVRKDPDAVDAWTDDIPADKTVITYCA
jgi:hypothetical protein